MSTMGQALFLALLAAQPTSVLHVRVTLSEPGQPPAPVARHALLVSDNPATGGPKRVLTAADGTAQIALTPGSYIVESERPVALGGKGYEWTQVVEIAPGRDLTLELTVENAAVVPLTTSSTPAATSLLARWQESIVAVWSPTARASGFVVDARGLLATDAHAIGRATTVAVQLSSAMKVPARVLFSDRARGAAIVWIDPAAIGGRPPLSLPCLPSASPALDERDEIVTIAMPHQRPTDELRGDVTALLPRGIVTDLRLPFGGAGGPAFDAAGVLLGLTSTADARGVGDVFVIRAGVICEALAAALSKMKDAGPPEPTRLPTEPTRPYPADALPGGSGNATPPAAPHVLTSSDFEVAFITPPAVAHGQQRASRGYTRSVRELDARAVLGALTDFGAWSEYFADVPPVLIVRVTPKMVEAWWKRLAREAARLQGAALPPLKAFKSSFGTLRLSCGGAEVVPLHPFVLEHQLSDDAVIREGLYVFGPEALGPHCGSVTLSLQPEDAREKVATIEVDAAVLRRVWEDFAPHRAAAPRLLCGR